MDGGTKRIYGGVWGKMGEGEFFARIRYITGVKGWTWFENSI